MKRVKNEKYSISKCSNNFVHLMASWMMMMVGWLVGWCVQCARHFDIGKTFGSPALYSPLQRDTSSFRIQKLFAMKREFN